MGKMKISKLKIMTKASTSFGAQKYRCTNPKSANYKTYGAKGIRQEYTKAEFVEWYCNNHPGTSDCWHVGRVDHSKNYAFGNIVFQTPTENSQEANARMKLYRGKKVFVFNRSMSIVHEANSTRDAAAFTGDRQARIATVCLHGETCKGTSRFLYSYTKEVKFKKETRESTKILVMKDKAPFATFFSVKAASRVLGIPARSIFLKLKGEIMNPYRRDFDFKLL